MTSRGPFWPELSRLHKSPPSWRVTTKPCLSLPLLTPAFNSKTNISSNLMATYFLYKALQKASQRLFESARGLLCPHDPLYWHTYHPSSRSQWCWTSLEPLQQLPNRLCSPLDLTFCHRLCYLTRNGSCSHCFGIPQAPLKEFLNILGASNDTQIPDIVTIFFLSQFLMTVLKNLI